MTTTIQSLLTKISSGDILSLNETKELVSIVRPVLHDEPNVLLMDGPVNVIGDLHGDVVSLNYVLEQVDVKSERVLCLGDYVDRGFYSVAVLSVLLCLKGMYKDRVFLLRGNHECREIVKVYGFYDELKRLYDEAEAEELLDIYCDIFDQFPLAAVIGGEVLAVHGGLSEGLASIDQISEIDRFCDVPKEACLMTDILWSDPHDDNDSWKESPRGISQLWGNEETQTFCSQNKLRYIVRSHQLVMEGAKWSHAEKILTIFTSANYCLQCQNDGGFVRISETLEPTLVTYPASIHGDNLNPENLSKHSIDISLLM
eukprot:TRINITY_DN2087_c0_g1_i4.p1 TRINITY_DN2087_c0_g1~~TRINITY_DN2087_c0_g1_i4.p1  ORF type:complete len:314 (+),score=64.64 TRINITY_DN2087_c0_g1_i4:80-1021(+)